MQSQFHTGQESEQLTENSANMADGVTCDHGDGKVVVEFLQKGSIDKARKTAEANLNRWKTYALKVAVLGSSGSGKSTLVNAMRGLKNKEKGAAPVGSSETTKECKSYPHPHNDEFQLWDVPGVGTKSFSKDKYLETIGLQKFDFFLICSAGRFSEYDMWLADEIHKQKKRFYMLRTKLDIDMRNDEEDHSDSEAFDESGTLRRLRDDYRKDLPGGYELFLISAKMPDKWEYQAFHDALLRDIPKEKKEALILSLQAHSAKAINEKKCVLQERIFKVSVVSALVGLIPIPVLGSKLNVVRLAGEVNFYKEQYGITEANRSRLEGIIVPGLKTPWEEISSDDIIEHVEHLGKTSADTSSFWTNIPIIGAPTSYSLAKKTLRSLLDQIENDALNLCDAFNRQAASS